MKTKIKITISSNIYEVETVREIYTNEIINIIQEIIKQEITLNKGGN